MCGKQANCSMTLLRKKLLPSLFLLRISGLPLSGLALYFICCCSLLDDRLDACSLCWFALLCMQLFLKLEVKLSFCVVLYSIRLWLVEGTWIRLYLCRAANSSSQSSFSKKFCVPFRLTELQYAERLFWDFLPNSTKNKMPTSALISALWEVCFYHWRIRSLLGPQKKYINTKFQPVCIISINLQCDTNRNTGILHFI